MACPRAPPRRRWRPWPAAMRNSRPTWKARTWSRSSWSRTVWSTSWSSRRAERKAMVAPRYVVIATGNAGKVKEFEALLAPGGFSLLTPKDIGFQGDVEETGTTYHENALIKARA